MVLHADYILKVNPMTEWTITVTIAAPAETDPRVLAAKLDDLTARLERIDACVDGRVGDPNCGITFTAEAADESSAKHWAADSVRILLGDDVSIRSVEAAPAN